MTTDIIITIDGEPYQNDLSEKSKLITVESCAEKWECCDKRECVTPHIPIKPYTQITINGRLLDFLVPEILKRIEILKRQQNVL